MSNSSGVLGQHRRGSPRFGRVSRVGCAAVLSFAGLGVLDTLPGDASLESVGRPHAARPSVPDAAPATSPPPTAAVKVDRTPSPPKGTGTGRRIVFDISSQRVWLVNDSNEAVRAYLVSGSRYDQLPAGTYKVYSKSRHTTSWHGTETMEYMVRFYKGERAAIGFHDLPVKTATGEEVQTKAQLGKPLSDGCIRQSERDALALWRFAPIGTKVVVVR